ncbi:MAG: 5-formyltetrahydrofolate cyclo-ligase [Salinirussus sp.]
MPNFEGAATAAERLADHPAFASAATLKCNPDAPQRPVRRRALENGTSVYVAVPRLTEAECFLELDPDRIDDFDHATTIAGADEYGTPLRPDAMPEIDCIVAGSVAVASSGRRIGKGEGYSDLEFALLRSFDRVGNETPVVTTVHERQLQETLPPAEPHDVPVDVIVTPERIIETEAGSKPDGIDWAALDPEKRAEIPLLDELAPE